MKKCIVSIIALAFVCQQSFSQKIPLIYNNSNAKKGTISLVKGDASCLKTAGRTFLVRVDFSEAQVVNFDKQFNIEKRSGSVAKYNKDHGEDYVKNWDENLYVLESSLCKKMNGAFKPEFKMQGDPLKADYLFLVRVGLFDFGHFVFLGTLEDGGTITKGLVEVYDVKKESLVAVFDVNYLRGKNVGYGNNDRFREYGIEFAKAMKKAVK